MDYKLFLTGGIIRDEILNLCSKDIDYSVVLKDTSLDPLDAFEGFCEQIEKEGYTIFLKTPSCFTVRAKFPIGHLNEKQSADFVLSRKETEYIKGTRKPKVVLGDLYDDLFRRDFTVNAMAKDEKGDLIDFFGGQKDLQDKILRTPSDAFVSFNNDPLRIIRAIRFSITKGLEFSDEIWRAINVFQADKMKVVSTERIREELYKCFKFNTHKTLSLLQNISLYNYPLYLEILPGDIWLEPTTKN